MELGDKALREQQIADVDNSTAISALAAEQLQLAIAGEIELVRAIEVVKDLCIAQNYRKDLYDFYLLYWAYSDLRTADIQWYWQGATRDNIEEIIRQRAAQFLHESSAGKVERRVIRRTERQHIDSTGVAPLQ